MCFSAGASFAASGGLAVLGGTSLAVARKRDKVLAAVPFLFAIQQGIEGFQWLRINAGGTSNILGYGFLFFALLVWPIYVPAFVYILDPKRKKIVRWFLYLGIAVALFYFIVLLNQTLSIEQIKSCINYQFQIPFKYVALGAYLVATFGPLFASSKKIFRWYGAILFVLAIISGIFFIYTFTSVWCFFAAIASSLFFIYIRKDAR